MQGSRAWTGPNLQTFDKITIEYMDAFEKEEKSRQLSTPSHAEVMRNCWNKGSFWYFQTLHSPKGLLRVFNEHIQRNYCDNHCTQRVFDRKISPYWSQGAEECFGTRWMRRLFTRIDWETGWCVKMGWADSSIVSFEQWLGVRVSQSPYADLHKGWTYRRLAELVCCRLNFLSSSFKILHNTMNDHTEQW